MVFSSEKCPVPLYPKRTPGTPLSVEDCATSSRPFCNGGQRSRMNHFAIDQWVDFSRDLVEQKERAVMRAHLASGCAECGRLADFTGRLTRTCSSTAHGVVPEPVLRNARSIFPVRPQPRSMRGSRVPIELIFDSFLVPAPAGLRATWQVGWQGLYRAGNCSVDLRIEPELKSSRAAVIGQITNHFSPEAHMSNLPVSLRSGKQVVAETVSNAFGEFQLEYDEQPQLKLFIELADSGTIRLPLKKIAREGAPAPGRKAARKRIVEER